MSDGWIKVYWKLKDSIAGSSAAITGVWLHLLLRVSRNRRVMHNGAVLEVGQVIISERTFAEDMQVSRKALRKMLNVFVAEGMLEVVKRDRSGTTLNVCNWRTYQASEPEQGPQRDHSETKTGPKRDRKETQTEIPKKERRKEGARARPASVEEVAAYCQERNNGIDPQRFMDHYEANGWVQSRGKPIKDWRAAVRTWESNGHSRETPKSNAPETVKPLGWDEFYAASCGAGSED